MGEFKQDDRVTGIFFTHFGDGYTVGQNCDRIIVSMENGQMAGVPWFEVWVEDKMVGKYNGALLAFIERDIELL